MNIIFANLNINARIIKIYIYLNAIFDNIFNDNESKHKLLNIFKRIVNNNDKRMRFRMRKIE